MYKRLEDTSTRRQQKQELSIFIILLHFRVMCICYTLSKEIKFRSFSNGAFKNILSAASYYHERCIDKQLLLILVKYPPKY